MTLFIPYNHPDEDLILDSPGIGRSHMHDASIPRMLIKRRNAYYYRPAGSGTVGPPIRGTLVQVDSEKWHDLFTYPAYLPVPAWPYALAVVPTYR